MSAVATPDYRPRVTVENGRVTATRWADAGHITAALAAAATGGDGTYILDDTGWTTDGRAHPAAQAEDVTP